uniref:Uncharacterized protein n=1 Tax=Anopheles minimus TaxID=112268 RepID=A0A182WPR3_9DIPT
MISFNTSSGYADTPMKRSFPSPRNASSAGSVSSTIMSRFGANSTSCIWTTSMQSTPSNLRLRSTLSRVLSAL